MFFSQKKILGLDIGTSSIKLAELESGRRGLTLNRFAIVPISPGLVAGGEIVDSAGVTAAIEMALRQAKTKRKHVATGMWGTSVIVKKISMPRMDENVIAEQIKWEAEQYIPFDVNEISLEHHILKSMRSGGENMDVLLVAAKQEFVFRYLETVEASGLKCSCIDVAGFALANCFEFNYGITGEITALLNIGAGVTNFVVVDRGEIIFSRDVAVGGHTYTSDINKSMGVSIAEAEALKISASMGQEVPEEVNSVIASTNDSVVDELRNSFEFFSATTGGASIQKFYVTGGSIYVPGLVEAVSKATGIPFEVMDPFLKVDTNHRAIPPDYLAQIKPLAAVVLGLAMRKVGDS
ncbi:MAG: pilus assembly protein PilM [Bdellovibrionaceae bacterium]|nr:pilus assembly protein PilM [Pseudobdellovibrionaceae bacterium]